MGSKNSDDIILAYVPERDLVLPEKESTIWRFMDITKFLSLIQKKALFFSQVKIIAEKYDLHEGKYPIETFEAYKRDGEKLAELFNEKQLADIYYKQKTILRKIMSEEIYEDMYINCWHISELDTNFMWSLYTERKLGIAIKSTVKKLINSFNYEDEVYVGMIKYGVKIIPTKSRFSTLFHKRINYKEENELRAVVCKKWNRKNKLKGILVPVDIRILIEDIYVRPKTPDYVIEIIRNLLLEYDVDKKVKRSSLDVSPPY